MSDPLPTFASRADRITYLLAEFKIPLSVMGAAMLVILAFATPQVPSPPDAAVHFSISVLLLAMPAYIAGLKIARYLFPGPDRVTVGVADPGTAGSETEVTGEYEKYGIVPDVWNNRTECVSSAFQPAEGVDYVVTRLEWYEEIGELEVRGVEQSDLEPGEAWVNASRVDDVYDHYQRVKRSYSLLKSKVSDLLTDAHDVAIMEQIGEHEKANLIPGMTVTDRIQSLEDEIDGLPDGPASDERTQLERAGDVDDVAGSVDEAINNLRDGHGQGASIEIADGGEEP